MLSESFRPKPNRIGTVDPSHTKTLYGMNKPLFAYLILILLSISSCIGTDVVDDVIVDEEVSIVTAVDSLKVGESFMFVADYFNEFGEKVDAPVDWLSTNETIVTMMQNGTAMAVFEGDVMVIASFGTAKDSVMLNAGTTTTEVENERTGTFMGRSSYSVSGNLTLEDLGDRLELRFGDNFRASNGPGLFVYLSNSITSVTGGIELGNLISNSGAQSYSIDKSRAQLETYQYVLIYCRPFGVTFGYGELEN